MNKVIISAPWGNWLKFPGTTSTLGTFTLKHRGGLAYRLWRCLLTLRYSWRTQAWVNRLGLPNLGVDSLPLGPHSGIVSIHGFSGWEWSDLVYRVSKPSRQFDGIEFNLSCPNVGHKHYLDDVLPALKLALERNRLVIAKLPPVRWMDFAVPLWGMGVRMFHLCNTLPSPGGGISGKPLKQLSLWAVDEVKQKWGEAVTVIGGGGITTAEDALEYRQAGADHVALGSMLLNPFNWRMVPSIVEAMK